VPPNHYLVGARETEIVSFLPGLVLDSMGRRVEVLHMGSRSLCRIEGLRSGVAVLWLPFPRALARRLLPADLGLSLHC
jgi:hypothetical protein